MTSLPQSSGGTAIPAVYVQDGATMYELPLAAADLANFQVGDMVAVEWTNGPDRIRGVGRAGGVPGNGAGCGDACGLCAARHFQCFASVEQDADVADARATADRRCADRHGCAESGGAAGPRRRQLLPGMGGAVCGAGGTGGRACFYYPRLQAGASTSEVQQEVAGPLFSNMLHAKLRAMPSVDPNDGETVLCYRSYFPAETAKVWQWSVVSG